MPNASATKSALSQFSPIGFHTSPCGYCRSNTRQEKKNQQKDGQSGTFSSNVSLASSDSEDGEIESSQSPSSDTILKSRASYYARTAQLQPTDYQVLLNHGWRRSGTLLYKPELRRSCCPHYTIRLPVGDLHIRKDQRSACNRWNKFVLGENYVKEAAKLHPKSRAEKQHQRNGFNLEDAIHGAESDRLPAEPVPVHKFLVTEESSIYTDEKYNLYVNYQSNVHGEPISKSDKSGFKRFLCETPLVRITETVDGSRRTYGSIHQCYRLDDRLIAMAVLDLLPGGVSAVYFMYHSDFEQWSFGKMSAMREASFARENRFDYYYMGYYINSCGKMRYKNDFQPQFFLDVVDRTWHRLDEPAQQKMTELGFYSPSELADGRPNSSLTVSTLPEGVTYRDHAAALVTAMEKAVHEQGKSLFELDFAGMQTLDQVRPLLNEVGIKLPGAFCRAKELVKWQEWDESNPSSIKGLIAELLACLGPEINNRIVVSFG